MAHAGKARKANIFQPPRTLDQLQTDRSAGHSFKPIIFLAGSIDNGSAIDWQTKVCHHLAQQDVVILNPRRAAWTDDAGSQWTQSISNPIFAEQVTWELTGLEIADVIFMYIAPDSKAPITLLELGLYAKSGKIILVSPPGFWRRGNVEVVAAHYGIPLIEDLPTGLHQLVAQLEKNTTAEDV